MALPSVAAMGAVVIALNTSTAATSMVSGSGAYGTETGESRANFGILAVGSGDGSIGASTTNLTLHPASTNDRESRLDPFHPMIDHSLEP